MSPRAMMAGGITRTKTASTMENTGAVEDRRIAGAGLPQVNITWVHTPTTVETTEARQISWTEMLVVPVSNGETVRGAEVSEAPQSIAWGYTPIAMEVSEAGADHTLVAVGVEATATSIVGDTKIPSYFQLPQRLHHMRMS